MGLTFYKSGKKGKALTRLVERISSSTGVTSRGIKRDADANRYKVLVEAQTEKEIEQIRAGLAEFQNGNLNAIFDKAIPLLDKAGGAKIDNAGWFADWISKAANTSDEDVQQWWAKILAGEAQSQGSFSKWALDAVACMSREDITAFTTLATCVWRFGPWPSSLTVVYWDSSEKIIPLNERILERAGLATGFGSPLEGWTNVEHRQAYVRYFEERHAMRFLDSLEAPTGKIIRLTMLGQELIHLCDAKPNDEYKMDCLVQWENRGVKWLNPVIDVARTAKTREEQEAALKELEPPPGVNKR